MRILEAEIALREETRGVEQAKAAVEEEEHSKKANLLSEKQAEISQRVAEVIKTIEKIELDEDKAFPKEKALLSQVEIVMDEARDILAESETGGPAIAAETEAIELLLKAKRINPKGGGGGGGSTPGGGGTGDTDVAALALIGAGDEKKAGKEARVLTQQTGNTTSEIPAEYRAGLDDYFSGLERGSAQ